MRFFRYSTHLVYKAPNCLPEKPQVRGDFPEVKAITMQDMASDGLLKERQASFRRMLSEGHVGLQIVDPVSRLCIAYGWIALDGLKPDHIPEVPEKAAWLHFDRVRVGFQGNGYHRLLIYERLKLIYTLYNAGDIDVYIDTAAHNVASRINQLKMGFTECGVYHVWSVGSKRIPMLYWQFGRWNKEEKHPPISTKGRRMMSRYPDHNVED